MRKYENAQNFPNSRFEYGCKPTSNAFLRYLRDEIKAGTGEKSQAIYDSGISDLDAFADFDQNDIVTLCATLRRPGGTVTVAGTEIPDRGVSVSPVCEIRLKLCAYAANYYKIVQRPIDLSSMAWDRIKHFKDLKTIVKNHTDSGDPQSCPARSQ